MKQFIFFLMSGGIAAAVNIGSRIFFSLFLPYEAAIILAFMMGLTTGFLLMKFFVFHIKSSKYAIREFFYFCFINLINLLLTFFLSVGCVRFVFPPLRYAFYPELTAHIIGVCFPILLSFIFHKKVTFGAKNV